MTLSYVFAIFLVTIHTIEQAVPFDKISVKILDNSILNEKVVTRGSLVKGKRVIKQRNFCPTSTIRRHFDQEFVEDEWTNQGEVRCKSVRVTELQVPSEAVLGESVKLSCSYDLGTEELYVVKWYKDDLEFYRFEPKDHNQSVYFPQPGIDIDLSQSGSEVVFLRNVALDTAGAYKCQVSTDAPTYSCVQAVKEMNVVVLPLDGPTISGGEGDYDFGDNVTLNCTSARSKPAADLRWIVNGKPIPDTNTTDHGVTVLGNALEVRSKSLRLPVTEGLLSRGKLAIKCEASFLGRMAMLSRDITIIEVNGAPGCSFKYSILLILIFITLWPGFR